MNLFKRKIDNMRNIIKSLLLLTMLCAIPNAKAAGELTLSDIYSGVYSPKSAGYGFRPMQDGKSYTIISSDGTTIIKHSYEDSQKEGEVLFDTRKAKECPFETFSDYIISDNGLRIIILRERQAIYRRSATYDAYHYDVRRNRIEPLSKTGKRIRVPQFSPDGRMASYVIDNNIYIKKFDYDSEVQVTTDGAWNKILNGVTDWVYEEELYVTSLISWSDDSRYLAFVRSDESAVKTFDMTIFGKSNYPYTYQFKYPKAGEDNSKISLKLYSIDDRKTSDLQLGINEEYYIPRMQFYKDKLYVFTLNRHQNHMRAFEVNPKSQVAKLWMQDKDEWYIDSNSWVRQLTFHSTGVYYVSEKSGRPQLYRFDHNGVQQQQLTQGEYDIDTFYGINPQGEVIYSLCYPTPMDRTIVAQNSKGQKRNLSPDKGISKATFSTDLSYYLLAHESSVELPRYEIYRAKDAKPITLLEDNSSLKNRLAQIQYGNKEFLTLKTQSGIELNAWMIKPTNFDPNKQYPLVMTQYSGPGSQSVLNDFSIGWEEYLANQGFIVACVDGRGTGGRGSHFKKQTYLKMGTLECQDQIEAAQALGKLSYIDAQRIGIFGWSFGGYMVLMTMTHGKGTFAAGVAVAPPTDWALYDTIYTERYMRTPKENPKGYRETSVMPYVNQLQGALLIIQGTADDNVHMQNVMHLTPALVDADKDFRMLTYTDKNHSIFGGNTRNHLFRQVCQHFTQHLKK